nr:class I SAM-dependent methyltransferase [Caldimonas mangrovi]
MEQGHPSQTAHRVAKHRAMHQLLDTPRVFDDPVALRILGPRQRDALRREACRGDGPLARGLRAGMVARSRIAEDALRDAIGRGIRQYVVLGAGLDTFAYRNPYPASALQVFEVDHPSTQAWKRRLLRDAQIPLPATLRFVPVDFETQTLAERLREGGYRSDEPAFFSWLGVTMYLRRESLLSTLGFIASTPGNSVVLDHVLAPSVLGPLDRLSLKLIAWRCARLGEPWLSCLEPHALQRDLESLGFRSVEQLQAEDINALLFDGGRGKLKFRRIAQLVKAQA